jgi:hypothetical protein
VPPSGPDSAHALRTLLEPVEALLTAYREVRLHVEGLPRLGVVPVADTTRIPAGASGHVDELSRIKEGPDRRRTRRRVSRTFTRLYLDSHIRKQLLTTVRRLRVEALGTDERAKELDAIIRRLETRAGELRGWAGLRSLVIKLPGLSAVIPAIAGVIWGVVSGAGVPSELQAARTPIVVIAVIALIALFGVWLPSVNLGFVVKRALLAGGSLPNERAYLTEESTLVWGEGRVAWTGFPPVNVYRWKTRRPPPSAFESDENLHSI